MELLFVDWRLDDEVVDTLFTDDVSMVSWRSLGMLA